MYKVNEIFHSIEGEGIRTGARVVFIRLYGCNLHCSYCDTRYSCEGRDYKEMTLEQILEEVDQYDCGLVTLTGGEPLLFPESKELVEALLKEGYEVNIETNGSIDITDFVIYNDVIITLDYKCKSSDMEGSMNLHNWKRLRPTDALKFVVSNREELEEAERLCRNLRPDAQIFLSPVFGQIEAAEIVEFVKESKMPARVQLQLHKFIWEPNKRGV